ncbi:MAG: hypothetical protein Q8940_19600 [Bacteroidota bacterium]|nr:hypothetical protein [Bacteroidota bacterium]
MNHYEYEEQKAFNDVFTEIFNDDYENIFHYMNPELTLYTPVCFMDKQEFFRCSRHPEKYDSVLSYLYNYHKPFFNDFTRLLIEAKGNRKKIDALLKSASEAFYAHTKSIYNKNRIFLYTDNKLLPFRDTLITTSVCDSKYDSSFFYQLNLKELKERGFNYLSIKNTGRIELKDSKYPKAKVRRHTPEIEMGQITFSRIAFNPDFTKGKFIRSFDSGAYGDYVTSLIYIEKAKGKWHYKSSILLKCISIE